MEGIVLAYRGGLAVALPGVGSAIGVGLVGEASTGLVTNMERFGQTLPSYSRYPGIYGLLSGFLIMIGSMFLAGKWSLLPCPKVCNYSWRRCP